MARRRSREEEEQGGGGGGEPVSGFPVDSGEHGVIVDPDGGFPIDPTSPRGELVDERLGIVELVK